MSKNISQALGLITPEQQKITTDKLKAQIVGWEAAFDRILNILEEDILEYYINDDYIKQNALKVLFDKIEKLRNEL